METSVFPAPLEPIKHACGSQNKAGKYDLGIHVLGLFLVLFMSCLGAGFPLVAKKVKWLSIPPRIFFFCKHFGSGVLIATAFAHLLPTAFGSLTDPCLPDFFTTTYPAFAGVIALTSLFTMFVIELWMHKKLPNAHSHGGITGEEFAAPRSHASHNPPGLSESPEVQYTERSCLSGPFQARSPQAPTFTPAKGGEMDSPSSQRVQDSTHQRAESSSSATMKEIEISRVQIVRQSTASNFDAEKQQASDEAVRRQEQRESQSFGIVNLDYDTVDPAIYQKMSMEITILEGGILFHSIFVGMTVSITVDGFIVLLIAILFHQVFEGLGLGTRIAAVPYKRGSIKPWLLVFAFGTTAPIGQAIGLAAHGSYDPTSAFALILVGTFNAISTGLLIWAALVDLIVRDFFSEDADRLLTHKKKAWGCAYVAMGAIAMSIVGAFA